MKAIVVLVGLAAMVSSAHADDRAAAREHFQKGTKAFDLGLYDDAIREYMAAYQAKDDPALLYNIGQAHRLAGHAQEALRFYRMYLVKIPRAENRDEVELKIAELQKLIEQQKNAEGLPPATVKPPSDPPPPEKAPEPVRTTTPPSREEQPPAPLLVAQPPSKRAQKIAGPVVAGLGVALLVPGIALSVLAGQYGNEVSMTYDPAKEASGETFGVAGPALAGLGGAAAAAGVMITVLGFRK